LRGFQGEQVPGELESMTASTEPLGGGRPSNAELAGMAGMKTGVAESDENVYRIERDWTRSSRKVGPEGSGRSGLLGPKTVVLDSE
jgi:hypothetical protein